MANGESSTTSGFLGIGGLIVGILVFFIVLNYFNILSLSQLYPNQLGFLPHRPFSQTAKTAENTGAFLLCPVKTAPCGEKIVINGKYVGLGFTLPEGFAFYAAIPGTAYFKSEEAEGFANHVNIGGTGAAQGYEAIYDFFGDLEGSGSAKVAEGDALGRAKPGKFYENKDGVGINVMFRLTNTAGKIVELDPSEFRIN